MPAYYNEIDPFAADWLRELIKAGHIAPGEVDTRSIEDVVPTDLAGFTQCHFFAGIAVWSYALRLAGWPDDKPVWTGSCPCQPFSAAGKGKGFADERHLWPSFFHLINQCRPVIVFGEQVASKDGLSWFDLVSSDLEGAGYACGAVDSCAAGFGAPHIRQRLYWLAHASPEFHDRAGNWRERWRVKFADGCGYGGLADSMSTGRPKGRARPGSGQATGSRRTSGMGDADMQGLANVTAQGASEGRTIGRTSSSCRVVHTPNLHSGEHAAVEGLGSAEFSLNSKTRERNGETNRASGNTRRLEHPGGERRERREEAAPGHEPDGQTSLRAQSEHGAGVTSAYRFPDHRPGPVNGHWRNADWLFCRDERWRPVESGTSPLAYGAANRVGRLRGYGNAINAIQAKEFIGCFMDYCESVAAWPVFFSPGRGGGQ